MALLFCALVRPELSVRSAISRLNQYLSRGTPRRCEPSVNRLSTKSISDIKSKSDCNYKARLISCGNEQMLAVDFELTFAVMLEVGNIRAILVLAII